MWCAVLHFEYTSRLHNYRYLSDYTIFCVQNGVHHCTQGGICLPCVGAVYTLDIIIKRKYNVITNKIMKKQEDENGNNSKKIFGK